ADSAAEQKPTAPIPDPKWLKDGWELRDTWRRAEIFRWAPRAFQQLEAHLLRQESRWRGGFKRDGELDDILARLRSEAARANTVVDIPTSPLAACERKSHDAAVDFLCEVLSGA